MEHNGHVRVVVVDDQAVFRDVARSCLQARGYKVVAEASSAASAIEAVRHHQPDAVLLDVQLGDHDGFVVCSTLTRLRPDLAVVLTSAQKDYEDDAERVESCGARGFVPKTQLHRADFARYWAEENAPLRPAAPPDSR